MSAQSKVSGDTNEVEDSRSEPLQLAIAYYYSNQLTPVPRFYRLQDGTQKKVINYGYSIRRVAKMHQISFSRLQRAIAQGGETKTRSEAHEGDMTLTIPEETALEEWCLHMHRQGYPARPDILRNMACAIVEDRERRNVEDAADFFERILGSHSGIHQQDIDSDRAPPNLELVGQNWHKRFLNRHPSLAAMYSRTLNNNRALNNDPQIFRSYFQLLKDTLAQYNIKPRNIYNMDEKGFLIGLIQKSMRVIVTSDEKSAFLRRPGTRETITVIEALGIFAQDIPPMIITKGEKHLYGWYHGDMPAHWTTAVSPDGWTDASLGLAWLTQNFEPYTKPAEGPQEYRLLILAGHESHIGWEFIEYALRHRIVCLCLPPHSAHVLQPMDVGLFSPYTTEYAKALDDAMRQGTTRVDKEHFMELFQKTREQVITARNCRSAFRATGVYPFDPEAVLGDLPDRTVAAPELRITTGTSSEVTPTRPEHKSSIAQQSLLSTTTPQNIKAVEEHVSALLDEFDVLSAKGYNVPSPTRKLVQQLGKSATMSMAREAMLLQTNRQLREEQDPGPRAAVAEKGTSTPTTAEAQQRKRRVEERSQAEKQKQQRLQQKRDEKACYEATLASPNGGLDEATTSAEEGESDLVISVDRYGSWVVEVLKPEFFVAVSMEHRTEHYQSAIPTSKKERTDRGIATLSKVQGSWNWVPAQQETEWSFVHITFP